jgi:homoserine kinase
MADSVSVRVPATSANLGPGFDALGVALTLYNRFHFAPATDGVTRATFSGESADELASAPNCLTLRAARALAETVGRPLPPVLIHIENAIPLQRGLGSSASAIIGGLVGANALLGSPLDRARILELATALEGHPDNVAPSLLGGFQTAVTTGDGVRVLRLPVPEAAEAELRMVVCVPEIRLGTSVARAFLPDALPLADAAFNVGRVSLLVAALCSGRLDFLRDALEDRLHQPYRAAHVPGFYDALTAARDAGAWGACLSGSGSTLLAFAPEEHAARVADALAAAFTARNLPARAWPLRVDREGTVVADGG